MSDISLVNENKKVSEFYDMILKGKLFLFDFWFEKSNRISKTRPLYTWIFDSQDSQRNVYILP